MSKNKKEAKLNSRAIAHMREAVQKKDNFAELFKDTTNLQKKSVLDAYSDDDDNYADEYRRSIKETVDEIVDTIESTTTVSVNKTKTNSADTYESSENGANNMAELFVDNSVLQKKSVFDFYSDDDDNYIKEYQNSFFERNDDTEQITNTPHENENSTTIPVMHKPVRIVDSVQTDMKADVNDTPTEIKPVVPLSSGVFDNSSSVVCDVATQTAPIIRREKGSNIALEIALDFAQKHHLVLSDKMLWAYNGQYYVPLTESDAQRFIFSEYRDDVSRGNTMSLIKNIVSLLKVTVIDTVEVFPANEHIIVFRNGTLEVANDHFRENSPRDLASSALSIDYDPSQKEMPVTNKFLNTITNGDSVLYKRLLQVIGYILSNDLRAKSFFYLEGVGNAGKSRFCDLIASFFSVNGANKVARIALQDLGNKFSMANLVNAKVNISEDLPDKPLSQVTVSRIKMISDGNCLEAEAKFIQSFSFRPQCKLLFASNHPLKIKDRDDAFVNRVIYIPFRNPIPKGKQDKHILEKMQKELPALFNYAYSAYKQLVESGYSWAGINIFKPEIVITNLSSTEEKEYAMKLFVELHCEESQDSTVAISEIQSKYNEFCNEHQYVPIIGDRFSREIYKYLPGNPERVKIGNQKRGFKGISLK